MAFQETGRSSAAGSADKVPVADPNDLLTPSDAARVLGLSPDSVRVLSDSGRLPAMRTVSGRRLFRRGDVDRLAAERASHAAGRNHQAPLEAAAAVLPVPADRVNGNGHDHKV
jgi:excisionase family DNA binding protein